MNWSKALEYTQLCFFLLLLWVLTTGAVLVGLTVGTGTFVLVTVSHPSSGLASVLGVMSGISAFLAATVGERFVTNWLKEKMVAYLTKR